MDLKSLKQMQTKLNANKSYLKDTLKAFNDFKTSKKLYEVMFFDI